MADFMTNFDNQRQAYLEHYGVKGMRWGVINEQEPMGQYPQGQEQDKPYTPAEYKIALKQAEKFRKIDKSFAKKRHKEIRNKIIKGVAIGAIVTGIAVAGLKGFAKKQLDVGDNPDVSAGLGLGLIGAKAKEFGRDVKTGWNTDIRATRFKKMSSMNSQSPFAKDFFGARSQSSDNGGSPGSDFVKDVFQKANTSSENRNQNTGFLEKFIERRNSSPDVPRLGSGNGIRSLNSSPDVPRLGSGNGQRGENKRYSGSSNRSSGSGTSGSNEKSKTNRNQNSFHSEQRSSNASNPYSNFNFSRNPDGSIKQEKMNWNSMPSVSETYAENKARLNQLTKETNDILKGASSSLKNYSKYQKRDNKRSESIMSRFDKFMNRYKR